jgi:hypothetical protein
MTTKEEVRKKTIEIINRLSDRLPDKLDSLLNSGAIDFPSEKEGYALPRMIMCALAREIEFQYTPPGVTRKQKAKINNLSRMI